MKVILLNFQTNYQTIFLITFENGLSIFEEFFFNFQEQVCETFQTIFRFLKINSEQYIEISVSQIFLPSLKYQSVRNEIIQHKQSR